MMIILLNINLIPLIHIFISFKLLVGSFESYFLHCHQQKNYIINENYKYPTQDFCIFTKVTSYIFYQEIALLPDFFEK